MVRHIIRRVLKDEMEDNDEVGFGDSQDVVMRWDGSDFDVLPEADDTVWKWGDGTKSFDMWWYGNVAGDYVLWDASASELSFVGAAFIRPQVQIVAKTGDYNILTTDFGKVFTTRGASSPVTFTLPAASGNTGAMVWFFNAADQNFTIDGTAGELMAMNDVAANSIAFTTASEKVGAAVLAMCDGTSWLLFVHLGTEIQSPTIAT